MSKVAPQKKPIAAGRAPAVTHEKAKEHATKVYEHSGDLEVLLRHKVYPKTVGEINGVQVRLNRVRTHVKGSLKKKELRKVKWQGVQDDRFGQGFLCGLIFAGLAFFLLWYWSSSVQKAPPSSPKTAFDIPLPSR